MSVQLDHFSQKVKLWYEYAPPRLLLLKKYNKRDMFT